MERQESLNGLGIEILKLLNEFSAEAALLVQDRISEIMFIPESNTISFKDISGDLKHYSLSEAEYIFKDNNKGFNIYDISFQKELKLEKLKVNFENGEIAKDDFVNSIGSLTYSQYNCEKIYNRIKMLQKAVNSL